MRRDIFQAIADPTRRAIIALIAMQAMTPNALAEHFDTSRQAVSKHLRILTECELFRFFSVVENKGGFLRFGYAGRFMRLCVRAHGNSWKRRVGPRHARNHNDHFHQLLGCGRTPLPAPFQSCRTSLGSPRDGHLH
jgi:DNA-binding transcriptional ArsR family regulator